MKTYYKTTYTIVVLSEEPLPDSLSLTDIEYEIPLANPATVLT